MKMSIAKRPLWQVDEMREEFEISIKKVVGCQTYHRFLRWMIFSLEWMVSQIKHYQISCIDCIVTSRFGTNVPFY